MHVLQAVVFKPTTGAFQRRAGVVQDGATVSFSVVYWTGIRRFRFPRRYGHDKKARRGKIVRSDDSRRERRKADWTCVMIF